MGILLQAPPAIVREQAAAPQPAADSSLVSILPNLYWSTSARGALLIVGADRYKQVETPAPLDFFGGGMGAMFGAMPDMSELMGQKKPALTPLGTPPREGWNPTFVATRFGAQLVRCGNLNVLAPQLLPDKSKDANPFGGADFAELMQEGMAMGGMGGSRLLPLLASLTPSQLQQATSSSGMLLSSLDNQQKALLQPLMRRTLPFRFTQKSNLPQPGPLDPAPLIAQNDQSQFRLRLTRALNIAPNLMESLGNGQSSPRMGMRMGNLVGDGQGGEMRTLALKSGKQLNPLAILGMLGGQASKGVPARKKPTELNTDAGFMNATVSLSGVSTVDELVMRVAQVTKVALFADQRIGKLTVSVRGTSARAGDVVQALCWAVGGAVRRISDDKESVYLLTEQVPVKEPQNPMAAMMGPISGMLQDQKSAERKAVDAKARLIRQKVLSQIPRGTGANLSARLWQVAEAKPTGENHKLPIEELPAAMQQQANESQQAINRALASVPEGTPGFTRRDPQPLTHVRCGQDLVAELVAPTLGAVATLTTSDANEIHPELPTPTPPPPVALPSTIKQRVLAAPLPPTDAAAAKLVESAVARGLTELRVAVPVGGEAALAWLGAAAKGKIPVVVVLAPLEPLTGEALRDRSWAGQSLSEWRAAPATVKMLAELPALLAPSMARMLGSDYLTPEAADMAAFVGRIKRLLALPGVTGFALERLAAPGYREGTGGMGDGAMFFWQAGANRQERVAFAKEQKSDAAELGGFSFTDLFSGAGTRTAWTKRTTARSEAFVKRLDTALTQAKLVPSSVLVSNEPARWEKWIGKYPIGTSPTTATRPALTVFSYTRILAQPAAFMENNDFAGFDEPEQFTGALGKELEKLRNPDATVRWEGLVIDLADQSFETALALLERALVAK